MRDFFFPPRQSLDVCVCELNVGLFKFTAKKNPTKTAETFRFDYTAEAR